MSKSMSMRIHYYTSENSRGECGLWISAGTKQQLRETLERHNVNPDKVFRFEVNKADGYQEVDVSKLIDMVRE